MSHAPAPPSGPGGPGADHRPAGPPEPDPVLMPPNDAANAPGNNQEPLRLVVLLGGLLLLWLTGRLFSLDLAGVEEFFRKVPLAIAGPCFVGAYVVVTLVVWFSKDLFRIAGALVYGPYWSTLFLCVGELINAWIHFGLSRRLGRGWVESRLGRRYRTLDTRIGNLDFLWLLLFRATPLIPYRFLDLAAGLTSMRFRRYLAACVLATPPRVFWLQFILAGVGRTILTDPAAAGRYLEENPVAFAWTCGYVVLVILVAWRLRRTT